MKRITKILLGLLLSFSFIFGCVGFAQLSDVLTLMGTASASPPEGLLIVSAKANSTGAVSNYIQGTVHSSTVDLSAASNNKASFTITVFNNTGYTYYFDKMVWSDDAYDNKNITPYSKRYRGKV